MQKPRDHGDVDVQLSPWKQSVIYSVRALVASMMPSWAKLEKSLHDTLAHGPWVTFVHKIVLKI